MRLIDAEKLFEDLFVNNGKLCPDKDVDNFPITINVKDVKKAISKQPTACDVDAVVEELKTARDGYSTAQLMTATNDVLVERFIAKEKAMNLAIKIVKGGGVFKQNRRN